MTGIFSSRKFHSFLGISVSVLLLLYVFSEVEFKDIQAQLLSANYFILIPGFFFLALHMGIRAWRWRFLLPSGESATFRNRFDGIVVGSFANFVLPLRAGEFVRPYMLSKISPISFAEGFASIVTERFFDLAGAIITFALLIPYLPMIPDWVSTSAWVLGSVAGAILLFILVVIIFPQKIVSFFRILLPWEEKYIVKKFHSFLEDFIKSAKILSEPKRLFAVLLLTALVWLSNYLLYYVFLFFLDIPQTFQFGTTVAVIIALAVAAPSAPGFIGVYQTACLAGFTLYQVGREEALAFSIITHLIQYVFFIGYGMFALSQAGLHLAELRNREATA